MLSFGGIYELVIIAAGLAVRLHFFSGLIVYINYSPVFSIKICWGILFLFISYFSDSVGGGVDFIVSVAMEVATWQLQGLQGVRLF